mgnify:CR=1 FL=1
MMTYLNPFLSPFFIWEEVVTVNILSTTRLKGGLEEALTHEFPQVSFEFCSNINEASSSLGEAHIIITYGEDLTEEHIQSALNLKWIMVISAGLEKMPLKAIEDRGILVTNARGIHKIPMAEYAIATMLQAAKNMKKWTLNQKQHKWDRRVEMTELAGKALTIIGPGAIGAEIARLAKAFRMTTYGVSRSGNEVEYIDHMYTIDDIAVPLPLSQYIISVLPQTKETEQLISKEHFDLMPRTSVFMNIGRGKTVNQNDLLEALESGSIAGAVLDVFEEEPLDSTHPFWDMDNVTLTPHFSSVTSSYQPRAIEIFKSNLREYLKGGSNLINLIDVNRGY